MKNSVNSTYVKKTSMLNTLTTLNNIDNNADSNINSGQMTSKSTPFI